MSVSPVAGAVYGLQTNQNRLSSATQSLATGRKSSIDNAPAFVLADGLQQRADAVTSFQGASSDAINTAQVASGGLSSIRAVVGQLQGLAAQAAASSDPTQRAALGNQYDQLRSQISGLASDSSYNGVNLIGANPSTVTIPGITTGTNQTVTGQAADATGLGISTSNSWATSAANAQTDLNALTKSQQSLDSTSQTLASTTASLQTNVNFAQAQTGTLQLGVAQATNADPNQAAASALAAQTYQQTSIAALKIGVQSQQSVLRLFA